MNWTGAWGGGTLEHTVFPYIYSVDLWLKTPDLKKPLDFCVF